MKYEKFLLISDCDFDSKDTKIKAFRNQYKIRKLLFFQNNLSIHLEN